AGGSGSDTYIFNIGDGNDTINEKPCTDVCVDIDVINIGVGVAAGDLTFKADGDDLIIGIEGHDDDSIRITGGLVDPSHGVEKIVLADGTAIAIAAVIACQTHSDADDTIVIPTDAVLAVIDANGGDDTITGGDVTAVVNGGSGDDTITTGDKDDTLSGGADNDTINAGGGNDVITGGTGDDTLTGGSGNDTYIYNKGDGHDTINEASTDPNCSCVDKLQFGVGIAIEDLRYSSDGNDLIINFRDTDTDSIRITGALSGASAGIEEICFPDGTKLEFSSALSIIELTEGMDFHMLPLTNNTTIINCHGDNDTVMISGSTASIIDGGAGNDTIYTSSTVATLYGGAGNDNLSAMSGKATFIGGTGIDILNGGHYGDNYVFNKGDGQDIIRDNFSMTCEANFDPDTLRFGDTITKDDIAFYMQGQNLVVSVSDTDKVTIYQQANAKNAIENIQLASGSSLSSAEINQIVADLSNYASDHGIDFTSVEDVKQSQELMNIITAAWDN
ncbi:calcium-binding protein, partial [Halodesulfovibrio sp.]|uniref:calcium-binding protein n=1 Tax=Halodesulfovibrio sp. TaxID=1912772 RepID=UPI0025E2015E